MEFSSQLQKSNIRWYLLGILLAVELLMSFSFLGYFHVEPISITTAYIPVLLAGALLGPLESTVLGFAFGLASMWKASASYVMATDQLFSPIMSGNPVGSILLSVGSRTLFGLMIGFLYLGARRLRWKGWGVAVVTYLGPTIHACLVYTFLWIFIPLAGYRPIDGLADFFAPSEVVANLAIAGLVLLLWRMEQSRIWRQFLTRVTTAHRLQLTERYHSLSLILIVVVTVCSSVAVAFYFVHRMDYVLTQRGMDLTGDGYANLLHLQIQFLVGILSLMALVIFFLIFNRRYATYTNYEARTDSLTGVMNRRAFFQICTKVLNGMEEQGGSTGYFIMMDIDWFKTINDSYGHPEGDRALKEAARSLRDIFDSDGLIGRVGGDEFAVLLYPSISREELEVGLRHLMERIHNIRWEGHRLSCSIGALPVARRQAVEELYRDADQLLYTAKEAGRDQYIIGTY